MILIHLWCYTCLLLTSGNKEHIVCTRMILVYLWYYTCQLLVGQQ